MRCCHAQRKVQEVPGDFTKSDGTHLSFSRSSETRKETRVPRELAQVCTAPKGAAAPMSSPGGFIRTGASVSQVATSSCAFKAPSNVNAGQDSQPRWCPRRPGVKSRTKMFQRRSRATVHQGRLQVQVAEGSAVSRWSQGRRGIAQLVVIRVDPSLTTLSRPKARSLKVHVGEAFRGD